MLIGACSDSHDIMRYPNTRLVIPKMIQNLKALGVDILNHSGDIEPEDINPELFGNLAVCLALTDEQVNRRRSQYHPRFDQPPPPNWDFSRPNDRVRLLVNPKNSNDRIKIYNGHKRGFEYLTGSEEKFYQTLNLIRRDYDSVRVLLSGHTHRQTCLRTGLIDYFNFGGLMDAAGAIGGYEYGYFDTQSKKVVFTRIPASNNDRRKPVNIGLIADSYKISLIDSQFWSKLAAEFKRNQVTHIIHFGNIAAEDIGMPVFNDFEVHYNLRPDQKAERDVKPPANWHLIPSEDSTTGPVVNIHDYGFLIQLNLGTKISQKSENDIHQLSRELELRYPGVNYVGFGFHGAYMEEGEKRVFLDPGDVEKDRSFMILKLPLFELTFDQILRDTVTLN